MIEKLIVLLQETGKEISRRRSTNAIDGKWEGDQLKTQADDFAHECLENVLPSILPVPVVSEENPSSQSNDRLDEYWLIDPIDGTRSLVDGYPGWVTQVALIQSNEPQMAVIFAPDLDLTYWAERGQGAYCNGVKLQTTQGETDRLLLIDNYPEPRGIAADLVKGMPCTGYVESGSIALKICRIADDTADLFVKDVPVRDWDIAAPMLIIHEAGGCLSTFSGQDYRLTGDYEKKGLIAAKNQSIYKQGLSFLETRISG